MPKDLFVFSARIIDKCSNVGDFTGKIIMSKAPNTEFHILFKYHMALSNLFMYGIFISNTLNNPTFRIVIVGAGLILDLIGAYLMYFGVGRQIEK